MLQVRHPRLYDTCCRTCAPVRQTRVVVLKSLLLGIHLLCVNVAAVGPLFCLALLYRRNAQAAPLARWIARQSCVALFVGMLLGGTIMGLYSFGGAALDGKRFYQALLTIPHDRLWWAAAELVFYYLCMLPVVRYWKPLAARRWPIAVLCLLSATNLIYHFTPMFVVVGYLQATLQTTQLAEPLTGRALVALYFTPPVLARITHHLLAAVAIVAGLLVLRTTSENLRADSPEVKNEFDSLARRGAVWVLCATLLQIPSGIWFLLSLPPAAQRELLGGNLWAAAGFGVAVVLVLLLLQKSLAVALGETARRDARHLVGLLVTIVLLMTGLLPALMAG